MRLRLVHDREQPLAALQGRPADPAVAGATVQRSHMPAEQPQPALAIYGDLHQAVATQVAKAEIVMLLHQLVPALLLGRLHRPYLHLAQGNRVSPHFLRHHIHQPGLFSSLPNFFAD